jgi:hypothetical protein
VPDASSTTRIIQQVGGSFGSAILALILASALASHHAATATARGLACNTAFWWAIGLTALALISAVRLPAAKTPPGQATKRPRGQLVTATGLEAAAASTAHRAPLACRKLDDVGHHPAVGAEGARRSRRPADPVTQLILGHREAVGCGRARDGICRPDIRRPDSAMRVAG